MHALEHDRHVVFTQKVRHEVGVVAADNGHTLDAEVALEVHRLGDGAGVVGVNVQAERPVKQPAHAFMTHVGHGAARCGGVSLGLAKETIDLVLLLVVRLATLDVDFAIAAVPMVGRGPVQVDAVDQGNGRVFPVPPVKVHHATRARDDASTGCDLAHQHAVGANRRWNFAVGVEGDDRTYIGAEGAHFVLILRRPDSSDFLKAQGGVGHDEAGVEVMARGVEDVVVLLAVDLKAPAHVVDFAVAEAHRAVLEDVACAEVGRGSKDEDGARLVRAGRGLGPRGQGHSAEQRSRAGREEEVLSGFHR